MNINKKKYAAIRLTVCGVLAALSIIFYTLLEFPVPGAYGFLKVNPSDIPAILAGIFLSPFYAIGVIAIRCIVHLMNTTTGGLGEVVDFVIAIASVLMFILPVKLIQLKPDLTAKRTAISYIVGVLAATVAAVIAGALINLVTFKAFMGLMAPTVPVNWAMTKDFILFGGTPCTLLRSALNFGAAVVICPILAPTLKRIYSLSV
ncbi:MAG: ECF transporter S component [Oscillospiraceae bacterium]|jgi:riboflavin transporter FmnP|nr:ECF transporter S component [Oscillospiraceae bacterium]